MRRLTPLSLALALAPMMLAVELGSLSAQDRVVETEEAPARERSVRTRVRDFVRGAEEEPGALEHEPGAKSATLRKGWIPVIELLRFIEETTGSPVVYPSVHRDPAFAHEVAVHFLADQEGFDAGSARFALEQNGYDFASEEFAPGRSAIVVTSRMSRVATVRGVPAAEMVIAPDELIPAAAPGTRAILVCSLRHADSAVIAQGLREIFEVQGVGGTTLQFVAIPHSASVVAIAPVEALATIRETIALLDVDYDPPTPQRDPPAGQPAGEPKSGSGG